MGLRARLEAQLARQLGHPAGVAGRMVARGLDRGNARLITEVVRGLESTPRTTLADVGFGGGLHRRGLRITDWPMQPDRRVDSVHRCSGQLHIVTWCGGSLSQQDVCLHGSRHLVLLVPVQVGRKIR